MRLRRRSPAALVGRAGATDPGPRPENQDRWAAGPGWAVVCDGVGGHAGGAVAAQTALDVVVAQLAARPPRGIPAAERTLREAAAAAHAAVVAARAATPEAADMATTLTAALAVPAPVLRRTGRGPGWVVLQVGDSPAWVVGPTGGRSATWDHNLTGELVRSGALSPEQAIGHRGRHLVTRALGVGDTVDPELHTVGLAPGEALVLASDGLSDVALPADAVPLVAGAPDPAAAAEALVALALERGTMDNVTVVVAR